MSQPTSAFDLARQAKWETVGFTRAITRYRDAASHQELQDLPPGQAVLKAVIPALSTSIRLAQATGADSLAAASGTKPLWAWPIQLLEPDQLAVITLTACFRGCLRSKDSGTTEHPGSIVSLSRMVSHAVRMQIEYDTWAESSPDVEKRLRRRYPKMTNRVWGRWRKKVEVTRLEPWSPGQQTALGAQLVFLLVQSAPEWFRLETRSVTGGRTQRCLLPTEKTIALLNDTQARAEVARPLLMPMLIPPVPWQYAA